MERKKIVITGMGAVTPIGVGVERYWDSLVQGVSGIDTIQKLDVEALPIKVAGEVKDFRAKDYMSPKLANGMEDFMQYAYVSAEEALAASGLEADPYRTGIVMSTALAGLAAIAIAALTRHLLATIGGGLLVFFLLRWAFGQLPI